MIKNSQTLGRRNFESFGEMINIGLKVLGLYGLICIDNQDYPVYLILKTNKQIIIHMVTRKLNDLNFDF